MQEELKNERREKKRLMDEIEQLRNEVQKQNFQAFTQANASVTAQSGRLPAVPGVREITLSDLQVGEQFA